MEPIYQDLESNPEQQQYNQALVEEEKRSPCLDVTVAVESPPRECKWHTIHEIESSKNRIEPQVLGNMHLKHDGASYIRNISMFTLSNTILLRCVWTSSLMHNTQRLTVTLKTHLKKFQCIISAKNFGSNRILIYYFCKFFFDNIKDTDSIL